MEKIIAIMQPYFMPYIGYFQLINLSDVFIVYDDVSYIKGGWINRNRILTQQEPTLINIEMKGASSNKKINEIEVNPSPVWRRKLKRKIELSYQKAPHFKTVFPLICKIIDNHENNLSKFVVDGMKDVCAYLGIETPIVDSSTKYGNDHLSSYTRVVDICQKEHGTHYVNPIGGKELYDKLRFNEEGLKLSFIKTANIIYKQPGDVFNPNLSIIDVMMYNDKSTIHNFLNDFELV